MAAFCEAIGPQANRQPDPGSVAIPAPTISVAFMGAVIAMLIITTIATTCVIVTAVAAIAVMAAAAVVGGALYAGGDCQEHASDDDECERHCISPCEIAWRRMAHRYRPRSLDRHA